MSDDKNWVRYALPLTVIKVDGTVTVKTAADGTKVPERTSEVSLGVEADRDNYLWLEIDKSWAKKREFEIKLSGDERLTGASHSSEGMGAELLSAGIRVAAFAAKAASLLLLRGIPDDVKAPAPVDDVLALENGQLARRRKEYKEAVASLQDALVKLATAAARDDASSGLAARLETVTKALAAARTEAAVLEAEFEAWRSERFPDWTRTHTYTIGVDRLPARPRAEDPLLLTDADLKNAGQVGEILKTFGVVVVRIGDKDPTEHTPTFHKAGVVYRLPRRCELAVYEVPEDTAEPSVGTPLRLRRLSPAWIVDSDSDLNFVPFDSAIFEKNGAGVDFGDGGTVSKITNKSTGAGSAVSTAVGGAGGTVAESLDQASKIGAAFKTEDASLTALKDQVERKELEAKLVEAKQKIAGAGNGTKPAAKT